MAIERRVRLWRAKPQHLQHLPWPATKERLLWIQMINGELKLNSAGAHEQLLQRGDGLGLIRR
jgi:hypothetical protein